MRVLHVHSGNLYGGVETLLATLAGGRRLCPELESEFALCFEGRLSQELRAAGATVHLLAPARVSRPWTVLKARHRLRRLLSPDLRAVCHSPWSQALFGPVLRRAGVPHALYLHGDVGGRHWLERLARRAEPDLVLANSRFTAGTVPALYPRARVEVAWYPVAAAAPDPGRPAPDAAGRARVRAELGTALDATVIIQVSRMEAWKGHRLHLEALARLRDVPGWCCWMVGGAQRPPEREYAASLEALARSLGLSERVRFLGQRSDVAALLAAADLHCQPNLGPEPFGITFIEALAAGLPVVTTAMGGALEIVEDGCGALVPPEPGALAAALRRLLEDPALRRRLGEAGPARARALCDPAVRLPRLAALLGELGPSRGP